MSYYDLLQIQELLFTKSFVCHVQAYGMLHWAHVPVLCTPGLK